MNMIKNMYKTTTAKVISPDGETDTFETQAGVFQGDTFAALLFITVLDYCVQMSIPDDRAHELGFTIEPRQTWKIGKQNISDLSFADNLALLSDTVEEAQEILLALLALETRAPKVGLRINATKPVHDIFKPTSNEPLRTMNGSKLQQDQVFKYSGSWIASTCQDIHIRKGQAWKATSSLQKIWKSNLPRQDKVNGFQTLVEPVLFYGSETWTLTKQLVRSFDAWYTGRL